MSVVSSLGTGKVAQIIDETTTGAGETVREFTIEANTVLVSVFVTAIDPGVELDVVVDTIGGELGRRLRVITFPTLTAVSTELLIKQPIAALDRLRITASYSGPVTYDVRVRGVTLGEFSARILGVSTASASQITIGDLVAEVVVPASIAGRSGVAIYNNNTSGTLYIGFTAPQATSGTGWPIGPGGALSFDLDGGVALWGIGSEPIDVRILEGGGS